MKKVYSIRSMRNHGSYSYSVIYNKTVVFTTNRRSELVSVLKADKSRLNKLGIKMEICTSISGLKEEI
jgi:hypothetical protein